MSLSDAFYVLVVIALHSVCGCSTPAAAPAESTPSAKEERLPPGVDIQLDSDALEAAVLSYGNPRWATVRAAVTATGRVDFVPYRVARVGPLVSSRIVRVHVLPGQVVHTHDLLVTLESADVGRLRAEYASATARLRLAEGNVERQHRMLSEGATSQHEVAQAEHARTAAVLEQRAAMEHLRAVGGDAADSALIAGLEHPGAGFVIRSPVDGSVLDLQARVGQSVGASDTLVVVGHVQPVWLLVDVFEKDSSRVHAGDDVEALVPAHGTRVFTGKVHHIAGVLDSVRRTVEAVVEIENADGALKPGMSATVKVFPAEPIVNLPDGGTALATHVLIVPRGAIQKIDGQSFVFVRKNVGQFELRAIDRGVDMGDDVEVRAGLRVEEIIATGGTFILKSEALKEQMGQND